ncbi:MAG: hypothetical protein QM784_24280 [Polyangiaceae bacterium]
MRFVRDSIGVELDFTPETLPLLDHYLLSARQDLEEKPELRELVLRIGRGPFRRSWSRRRLNGFWQVPTPDTHTWRVCGRHIIFSVNPVGVVAETVVGGPDGDGPSGSFLLARADREDVTKRLSGDPSTSGRRVLSHVDAPRSHRHHRRTPALAVEQKRSGRHGIRSGRLPHGLTGIRHGLN